VGAVSGKPCFARLDIETVEMYEDPDGNFPNHPADPHFSENFKDLSERVRKENADIGIFFDGDADRAYFVDESGNIAPTDLIFAQLIQKALDGNKGENVYFDLRFSKSIPDAIKKFGGNPVMLRVGNPFFKRSLREDGGVLGGEYSGHIMYAENYSIDDGLFAALKVLEILSRKEQKLSSLIEEMNIYETSPEISLEAKNPETVFDRIRKEFPGEKEIELDGLYLDMKNGFISVRQSQNELELFRVRVEAKEKKTMESRLSKVLEIIKS
jgi:phosphomannomutase